jgi:hypothetical protein
MLNLPHKKSCPGCKISLEHYICCVKECMTYYPANDYTKEQKNKDIKYLMEMCFSKAS